MAVATNPIDQKRFTTIELTMLALLIFQKSQIKLFLFQLVGAIIESCV